MPRVHEDGFKHVRVRNPSLFSTFRVLTKMSHLDEDDQKLVRKHVRKSKRAGCKFTVGKLKDGKKIEGRSWKLQKIMVKKSQGGGQVGRKKKAKKKGKKWGKIGAPHSAKRKRHLARIRKRK